MSETPQTKLESGDGRMTDPRPGEPAPQRIQRKRTKGWRMPANAVYVGRPTKFGNPFRLGGHYKRNCGAFVYIEAFDGYQDASYTTLATVAECLDWYRWYRARDHEQTRSELIGQLRGKDLACWCRLDQPCHADVLLEIANGQ